MSAYCSKADVLNVSNRCPLSAKRADLDPQPMYEAIHTSQSLCCALG
jgi:hypothetical protein